MQLTPMLNLTQAADWAGVSPGTIRREVRRGTLRCWRVGGRRAMRFREEDLMAWYESTNEATTRPTSAGH